MRHVDPRIEPLLAHMAQDAKLPNGAEDDIRQAIVESPYLSNLLGQAAADKQIGRIAVSHGAHNAGHFEAGEKGQPGTLYISDSNFSTYSGGERIDLLTEIMGHETMHGVLSKSRADALDEFTRDYQSAMFDAYEWRETIVDLTKPVGNYLDRGRQEEALAEISGLRALDSRIKNENPGANEAEIEKDFLDRSKSQCVVGNSSEARVIAPGLSYEALTTAPYRNGEPITRAVERCFYDGPSTLGKHGDSDYRNYYGVDPLARIARDFDYLAKGRQPPDVRVDLKDLGLDPRQLERNGLKLGNAKTFTLTDGSNGMEWVQLKNTGSPHAPDNQQDTSVAPNRVLPDAPAGPALSPSDQAMLDQIRGKLSELDKANGRSFDATSERMAASLLATAKDAGMTRVDHVALSKQTESLPAAQHLFIVQGEPTNPASLRAYMPTAEAAQRPVQESLSQVEAVNHRQVQAQSVDQHRTQDQQQRPAQLSM